jgi:hypothetical protein
MIYTSQKGKTFDLEKNFPLRIDSNLQERCKGY